MQTTPGEAGAGDDLARLLSTAPPRAPSSAIDFRIIADKSLSLIVVADHAGAIQYVNSTFCESTGFSAEEVIGRRVRDLGQIDPATLAELWNTLGFGLPWRGEFAASKKNGDQFWVYGSISPITDGSGQVTHFIAVNLDITERKRAEEALRESEERFRKLAETTTAAAFIFEGSRIRYANSAASDVTGYSSEELLARNFWEIAQPDIDSDIRERLQARALGEPVPPRAEVRIITKGGEARWVDFNAGFVELDGREYVLGTAFDITARKLAEEAHRRSEERYRILYQDNPSMYFTLAEDLTVLSVNQHGAEQLGYTAEDLVGEPVLLVVHADDQTHVRRQLESLLRRRGARHGLEFRKVRKDGEVIWVKESVRVTRDVDGALIILVVCEDISERKRMEEALQGLREELEHKADRAVAGNNPYNLSFRELTVLHLVTGGRSDKEISVVLGIRPQTVSKHVANVRKKMRASSRTQAGVRALREGLVT